MLQIFESEIVAQPKYETIKDGGATRSIEPTAPEIQDRSKALPLCHRLVSILPFRPSDMEMAGHHRLVAADENVESVDDGDGLQHDALRLHGVRRVDRGQRKAIAMLGDGPVMSRRITTTKVT